MKIYIILILAALFSCSVSSDVSNMSQDEIILGKWKVENVDINGGYEDIIDLQNENSFIIFFPPNYWKNSKGTIFQFERDSIFSITMLPKELSEKIELKYFIKNKKIEIEIEELKFEDNSVSTLNITIDTLMKDQMSWSFGNF
ncbi:MAG: hypothetical protein H3C31_03130 [Brumimicrobium sp.]|nr:hypothetical protein [Brumimicrobium sp.]